MTAPRPPVPSKNALRALRNIAFGSPGLIAGTIGAIGGACGLVAVNCEARRQVKLAEKTKRTIASIANGRSSSRVRRMFEAAERGEGFGIESSNSHRRRQKRDLSSDSTRRQEKIIDDDAAVEVMLRAIKGITARRQDDSTTGATKDSRAGPGQPVPSGDSVEDPSVPWCGISSHSSRGRPRSRLHPSNYKHPSLAFNASTSFAPHGPRLLSSNGSPVQVENQTQHIQTTHPFLNEAGLRHSYAMDLQESAAERIRLATMRPMKGDSYSVYARQDSDNDRNPISPADQIVHLTKAPAQVLSLDLAPKVDRLLLAQSLPLIPPHSTQESTPDSTTSSSNILCAATVHTPPGRLALDKFEFSTLDSAFTEWPSIPLVQDSNFNQILSAMMESLPKPDVADTTAPKTSTLATVETSETTDVDLDVSEVFNISHATVKNEMSNTRHVKIAPTRPNTYAEFASSKTQFEPADNQQVSSSTRLRVRYRTSGVDWLPLLQSAKNVESQTGTIERDVILTARQLGQDVIAVKITEHARKRTQEITTEDTELLAQHWGVQIDTMKHGDLDQPSPHNHTYFHRSSNTNAFLVPPPNLGDQGHAELSQVLQDVGYDRYVAACIDVMNCRHGKIMFALSSKLAELVAKGTEQDIKLAELLYHSLHRQHQKLYTSDRQGIYLFPMEQSTADLAHILFKNDLVSRAASIVFPYRLADATLLPDHSRSKGAHFLYSNAHRYLDIRCHALQDPLLVCEEVRHLIRTATLRGVLSPDYPMEYLMLAAIRALCTRGYYQYAERLLEEIERDFTLSFTDTLKARTVLICAAANRNDVVKVRVMLDEFHEHGLSRIYPIWHSNIFATVLDRHLIHNPLLESYNLLIHGLAYCGLVPDNRISSSFIAACLKNERYDFVQEYVQAVRQLYPFLNLGTDDSLCAWRVARAWKEMEASCDQIQKGCLAMAYCATSEPFGKALRDAAEEAVRLDLSRCLSKLLSMSTGQDESEIFRSLRCLEFEKVIEKAQRVATAPGRLSKRYLRVKDHLFEQIKAVTKLNRLFGGDHMGDHIEVQRVYKSALPKRLQYQDAGDQGGFALQIFQEPDSLPRRDILWKLMASHYSFSQRQGLLPNHDLLRHLIPEMNRYERAYEASQLINAIYQSPYVSGPEGMSFNEDLFDSWFDISIRLSSPKLMTHILWAFLKTTTSLVISHRFLLRVETALHKYLYGRHGTFYEWHGNNTQDELQYLLDALKKRYARQMGSDLGEDRQLWNEYKSWDELTTPMPPGEGIEEDSSRDWSPDQFCPESDADAVRAF